MAPVPEFSSPEISWFTGDNQNSDAILKRKIAQMILVGFRGTELDPDSSLYRDIAELGIGGVILYDLDLNFRDEPRNISSKEQVTRLTEDLQNAAVFTLFIAIDQEGGHVNRLRCEYGFPPNLSAKEMSASRKLTKAQAEETAALLAEMGINLNFAPCVDLDLNPDNPVIGYYERSFSANPEKVIRHAAIWIDAHRSRGILSCIKHFPGHGSSSGDTHLGWVDVTSLWQEKELYPYQRLIGSKNADSPVLVMTGHVYNEKLDPQYPATLSHAIITGILRNKLKYNGIVVSDDMEMAAIKENYSFEEALEKAINAGVDILCLSNNSTEYNPDLAQNTLNAIYTLVQEGKITESRIEESWERIVTAKQQL